MTELENLQNEEAQIPHLYIPKLAVGSVLRRTISRRHDRVSVVRVVPVACNETCWQSGQLYFEIFDAEPNPLFVSFFYLMQNLCAQRKSVKQPICFA